MTYKKQIIAGCILISFGLLSVAHAETLSDIKTSLTQSITTLLERYESKIASLEQENKILRDQIVLLKGSGVTSIVPVVNVVNVVPAITVPATNTGIVKTDTTSQVIDKLNATLPAILSENNLDASGAIGLFEFIEPNAVFISIDDGKNPVGVTAFKTKILYTYDPALNLTKIGLFDLNYDVQMYKTIFGSNPYTKSTRKRVSNPTYKGKLLDLTGSTVVGTGSIVKTTTDITTPISKNVTFAQIKAAYDKNKLNDALALSDVYIITNQNDIETLKIRYRSYYMIGKYENSLAEVKKIETLSGASFDRTIACDAAVIAKIAKKTDTGAYYSAICKKK